MTPFELVAVLMVLVGLVGWVNVKTVHMPHGVAMLLTGLAFAAVLFVVQVVFPGFGPDRAIIQTVGHIDFVQAVTGYMLAFLLFAGSMQVDLTEMRRRGVAMGLLATLGVVASTVIVGFGLSFVAGLLDVPLPLPWALVFGALIAPTDPVAVLATVRHVKLSKSLTAILQGEALFNDGVGIVVFTALLALAVGTGEISPLHAVGDVLIEAVGGFAIGIAASWVVIRLMKTLDDFVVEVSLSIALAMGVYAGAQAMGLSGAIAVVGAGMLFGGSHAKTAMAGETERYMKSFWILVDEILNAMLFLLLGIEMLVVPFYPNQLGLLAAAIILVVLGRFLVVLPWGAFYRLRHRERGATAILGWGGLHGALSLALALSIPNAAGPQRTLILAATFAVVAFSIAVQGLTFGPLARRYGDKA